MFAARGVIVCLAFFAVMYGGLSCLVAAAWKAGQRPIQRRAGSDAGVLFGIRILPFAVSALFAIFFTFPSFWLMERRSLDEDLNTFLLALCASLLLIFGVARAVRASRLTRRQVSQWLCQPGTEGESNAATLRAAQGAPALMLVGIWRPEVVISDAARAVLSENELRVAVRHELGHGRSWDNLKKLLLNAIPFPGMRGVEQAWREAIELSADDSAVECREDALDLAAALIKLSRSAKQWREPQTASAFVCSSSAVSLRVHRLLDGGTNARLHRTWPWLFLALLIATVIVSNYGTALVMTHWLTELLVP